MSKKIFIIGLLVLFIVPNISALQVLRQDINISIVFRGERDFSLVLPNTGDGYVMTWANGTTHSNFQTTYPVYYNINEVEFCAAATPYGQQYNNVTSALTTVITQCTGIQSTFNDSQSCKKQYDEACRDRDIYETNYLTCRDQMITWKNQSEKDAAALLTCTDQANMYKNQASTVQQQTQQLTTCTADLAKARSDKTTWAICALILGAVGYNYYLKKKKPSGAPSEFAESGNNYDSTNQNDYPPQQGFEGPRF